MSFLNQAFTDIDPTIGEGKSCRCEGGFYKSYIVDLSDYDLNNTFTFDADGVITGITLLPDTVLPVNHPDPSDLVTGEVTSEPLSEYSTKMRHTATYSFEMPPTCNDVSRAEDIISDTCCKLLVTFLNCGDCCEAIVEGISIKDICGETSVKCTKIQLTKNVQFGDNTGTSEATRQWTFTVSRNCSEMFTSVAPSVFDAAAIS